MEDQVRKGKEGELAQCTLGRGRTGQGWGEEVLIELHKLFSFQSLESPAALEMAALEHGISWFLNRHYFLNIY